MSIDIERFRTMLRALRGPMSQSDVSKRTGINQQTISHIENGRIGQPSFSTVVLLARAYNVTPTDMAVLAGLWESPDPEQINSSLTKHLSRVIQDIEWEMQNATTHEQVYFAGILRGQLSTVLARREQHNKLKNENSPLPNYLIKRLSQE